LAPPGFIVGIEEGLRKKVKGQARGQETMAARGIGTKTSRLEVSGSVMVSSDVEKPVP
jgi:hypothetical protein